MDSSKLGHEAEFGRRWVKSKRFYSAPVSSDMETWSAELASLCSQMQATLLRIGADWSIELNEGQNRECSVYLE